MRARSSARGSESTSETRDTLSSLKDSLLPSTSSSWESEASSLLGQPQRLPAGLPHKQVTFLPLGRTLLTLLNSLSMSHPHPRRSQWLQRVWSLLAELRALDFPISVAVMTFPLLLFTPPYLQPMQTRSQQGWSFSPELLGPFQEGDRE